jgi:hypothetical protein
MDENEDLGNVVIEIINGDFPPKRFIDGFFTEELYDIIIESLVKKNDINNRMELAIEDIIDELNTYMRSALLYGMCVGADIVRNDVEHPEA